MDFLELVELVKKGYDDASLPYKKTKDESVLELPIFKAWFDMVPKGPNKGDDEIEEAMSKQERKQRAMRKGLKVSSEALNSHFQSRYKPRVVELGCGCGAPVGQFLCESLEGMPTDYLGVDLSETQIGLAKEELPNFAHCFQVEEMLEFCKQQENDSICGALSLFTLFHLPRRQHVELFSHLLRILKPDSPLLFNVPPKASEGFAENWLGGATMYWSNFSVEWYELTLDQLGLELVWKFKDVKEFLGEKEVMWYLLYKVPSNKTLLPSIGDVTTDHI